MTPRRGPRLWVRWSCASRPDGSRPSAVGSPRVLERGLLAPERGADEVVGQDEPRLGHGADRQFDLALASVVGDQRHPRRRAIGPERDACETPAKALASVDKDRHLDPRLVADGAGEIRFAHQRPIDARGGNLQPIGLRHRLLDVEDRRQRHADAFAILDRHRPVGTLRHDLNRRALARGNLDPDKPVAQIPQNRRRDAADALARARIFDQARFIQPLDGLGGGSMRGFDHATCGQRRPGGNKKERVPAGAHSQLISPYRRAMRCR